MSQSDDRTFPTIAGLRARLDAGEVTAEGLTEESLRRLAELGGPLNAVAALTADRALAEARAADAARAKGPWPRRLLGIPYGVKDLFPARGYPARFGSRAFTATLPDEDAAVVRRLSRAGAVLTSKLAMAELAGFHARHPMSSDPGPIRNPWDRGCWAGGSSGGSAVAVAVGALPFSIGTETAGSIGSPAVWCGVTGLRPTFGVVGRSGGMPLAWSLDKVGVLAHTAEDCATVLAEIAGADARDPGSVHSSAVARALRFGGPSGHLRIGWSPTDIETAPATTQPALRQAIDLIHDLGDSTVEMALPDFPYRETLDTIVAAEGSSVFGSFIESDRVDQLDDPEQREALQASLRVSARDYLDAMRRRELLARALQGTFRDVDVIVSYNFAWPRPVPSLDRPFTLVPINGGNTALVWAGNLAGLPAVFLPAGLGDDGMPVGIQLVGRPFADAALLALGARFQSRSEWHLLRPPLTAATDGPR